MPPRRHSERECGGESHRHAEQPWQPRRDGKKISPNRGTGGVFQVADRGGKRPGRSPSRIGGANATMVGDSGPDSMSASASSVTAPTRSGTAGEMTRRSEGQRLGDPAYQNDSKAAAAGRRLRHRQLENCAHRAFGISEQQADAGRRQYAGIVGIERRHRLDPASRRFQGPQSARAAGVARRRIAKGRAQGGEAFIFIVVVFSRRTVSAAAFRTGITRPSRSQSEAAAAEPKNTRPSDHSASSAPIAGPTVRPAFDITRVSEKCLRKVSGRDDARGANGRRRSRMKDALENADDDQRDCGRKRAAR